MGRRGRSVQVRRPPPSDEHEPNTSRTRRRGRRRRCGGAVERVQPARVAIDRKRRLHRRANPRRPHGDPTVSRTRPGRNDGVLEPGGVRRLFEYLQGANESRSAVAMTAPAHTDGDVDGESIEMTSPVRTEPEREAEGESVPMTSPVRTDDGDDGGDGVRMGVLSPRGLHPEHGPTADRSSSLARRRTAAVGRGAALLVVDDRPADEPPTVEAPRNARRIRRHAARRTVQPRLRRSWHPSLPPDERGRRRGGVVVPVRDSWPGTPMDSKRTDRRCVSTRRVDDCGHPSFGHTTNRRRTMSMASTRYRPVTRVRI